MKTFLLDIIPRIQRFSKKLDNLTVLTNKHWVIIDEGISRKVVFIFRDKDNQLLISDNGKIEKGTWEYLGNNSLLIDRKDGSYLFKHGFIDDNVLALKVDGKEEYALLANENKFNNQLNSLPAIIQFLSENYLGQRERTALSIPPLKVETSFELKPIQSPKTPNKFFVSEYPELVEDVAIIQAKIEELGGSHAYEIVTSFCRNHSISIELSNTNPSFLKQVVSGAVPTKRIERLFKLQTENESFLKSFEEYLRSELI